MCLLLKLGHGYMTSHFYKSFYFIICLKCSINFKYIQSLFKIIKKKKKRISSLVDLCLLQIPHQLAVTSSDTIVISGREDFLSIDF